MSVLQQSKPEGANLTPPKSLAKRTDFSENFTNILVKYFTETLWHKSGPDYIVFETGIGTGANILRICQAQSNGEELNFMFYGNDINPDSAQYAGSLMSEARLHNYVFQTNQRPCDFFGNDFSFEDIDIAFFNPPQHLSSDDLSYAGYGGNEALKRYLFCCLAQLKKGTQVIVPISNFAYRKNLDRVIESFSGKQSKGSFEYDVTKHVNKDPQFYRHALEHRDVGFHFESHSDKTHTATAEVLLLTV